MKLKCVIADKFSLMGMNNTHMVEKDTGGAERNHVTQI